MEHLIPKYLQGRLTLDEQHEFTKWLQSDERNAETLKKIHAYWHFHRDNLEEEQLDVRHRLHEMMDQELKSQKKLKSNHQTGLLYWTAASLFIVCSILFMVYQFGTQPEPTPVLTKLIEKVSLPGQKITTVLPDGTRVKLNGDSKLIVPAQFESDMREVTLIGEAFFEVKRDERRPFIIKTDSISVQVLGTSFNVYAYSGEFPSVAVKTGKVAVNNKYNNQVELEPNQQAKMVGNGLEKSVINEKVRPFEWTNQHLVFNDESLDGVLTKISRWYGVEIEMRKETTLKKRYTANYDNPTIKEMIEVLAYVYDFKYEHDEKEKRLVIK